MKSKTSYIYSIVGLLVIAVIAFSIFTSNEEKAVDPHAGMEGMPQDDIHKGLTPPDGQETPNKSNVRPEFYDRLDSVKTAYKSDPTDTAKMKAYADLTGMAHGQGEALELYNKILDVDPNRIDVMLSASIIYYRQKNFDKTREMMNRILKIEPDHLEANYNLGAIEIAAGNKEKAKEIWQSLVEKYPGTELAEMSANSLNKISSE